MQLRGFYLIHIKFLMDNEIIVTSLKYFGLSVSDIDGLYRSYRDKICINPINRIYIRFVFRSWAKTKYYAYLVKLSWNPLNSLDWVCQI